jgi:AcrR family transcriptional regulator
MPSTKETVSSETPPPAGQNSTEQRLLREAARLFRKQGFDRTSTRELASAIGLRSASLYHYMKTKEDLLTAICTQGNQLLYDAVSQAAAAAPTPLDKLRAVIRVHLEVAIENRDIYIVTLSEAKALSPRARREFDRQRDAYTDLLVGVVEQAQESGDLRNDMSAETLVLPLRNLVSWTTFWYRPGGDLTLEEVASLMQRIFLEGALSK